MVGLQDKIAAKNENKPISCTKKYKAYNEFNITSKKEDELFSKPFLKLVVKPKTECKEKSPTLKQNEKTDDYSVKVVDTSSALKLTFIKSSKDSSKNPSSPHSKSRATPQDNSSSSRSLKSSPAAENRDKHSDVKGHGSSRDHKYEKNTEKNGKQTTCKSSSNNTKSHKVVSKSHDSTKKSAAPKEMRDEVEMKKQQKPLQHTSTEMSIAANKPETKHDGRGDKSAKPTAAADSKKVVRTDGYLRRKFGCRRTPKVTLRRMSKEEIRRFTHRAVKIPRKTGMLRPKLKSLGVSSKIDKNLQASALMDLLAPAKRGSAPTPRPKIIFAPRRVVKCHNTAATAAPVGKQRQPQPAFHGHSQQQEGTKICVPSEMFPREMIGLLERDIERAVPFEIFINNRKRSDKIDWFLLDGKMQHGALQKQPLPRSVNVKILMPPQYFATDQKYELEEQEKLRNEAIAKYVEQREPMKVKCERAKKSHGEVRKYMELKVIK